MTFHHVWCARADSADSNLVHILGMKGCMILVESFCKKERASNELSILQKEMLTFLLYFEDKQEELELAITDCQERLDGLQIENVDTAAFILEEMVSSHRYVANRMTSLKDPSFIRGEMAILSKSLSSIVRPNVRSARYEFGPIIGL